MSERDGEPTQPSPERSARENKLSERLRNLDRELDHRRASREAETRPEAAPPARGYGVALRMGADFVAGVIVGGAIGWGIDRLFGTSPWGLMIFLLFGFAAGILTLLRTAGRVKQGPAGPDDGV